MELEELAEGNEGLVEWLAMVEAAGVDPAGGPDLWPDWVDAYEV